VFSTAASFRRHLQHELPAHLAISPRRRPVARLGPGTAKIPAAVRRRWPAADLDPAAIDRLIAGLPIDHDVAPAPITGGALAAVRAWRRFRRDGLDRYASERNQPDSGAQSQLSPYLHFGHISVHQVFAELMEAEGWSPERLAPRPTGSRRGWWGASEPAEAFLDEIVTWREIGLNRCANDPDHDRYESLPRWARQTLADHAGDPRPHTYSAAELEAAATGDPLWNASQTQLVRDGTIHNYLRMLWGKKILEWSPTPRAALDVMMELNNKYAVDGRDPNSYSGIFWVLGRYDRPWGPERPIFGKVRYMSSESAARKLRVEGYMARYRP
jgi:deoxyribodipyrimidine photo-lyase